MCGFCGQIAGRRHWSAGPDRSRPPTGAERQRLLRLAAKLLTASHIRITPWANGFQVTGPTGRSALLRDLGDIWHGADQVSAQGFDPLDEAMLDRLEGGE